MSDDIPSIPIAPELPKRPSTKNWQQNGLNEQQLQDSSIKPLPQIDEVEDIYFVPKKETKQPEIKQSSQQFQPTPKIKNYPPTDIAQQTTDISSKQIKENKQTPPQEQQTQKQTNVHRPQNLFWETIKVIAIFIGLFIFIYLLLTFPAHFARAKYFFENLIKPKTPQTIEIPKIKTSGGDLLLSTMQGALENATDSAKLETTSKTKHTIDISDLENNHLIIPKLDVKTPIIWESPPDEEIMLKNLQKGVVHYNGTALPDQNSGNVFISGHSSYYWWDKGKYKTIFVNLDKLEIGDEMALAYNDKVYVYKVFDKFEVKPEQVEVLNQTDKPILSLMTCVPIGTNLRRLIVKAERIDITSEEETKSETIEEVKPEESKDEVTKEKPKETPPLGPTIDKENLELLPWR